MTVNKKIRKDFRVLKCRRDDQSLLFVIWGLYCQFQGTY